MHIDTRARQARFALALLAMAAPVALSAQAQDAPASGILVSGENLPDMSAMTEGPDVKGVITARHGDKLKVTAAGGASTIVFVNQTTRIKGGGLFGGKSKLGPDALVNGLPVTIKTMQAGTVLLASQVSFRNGDYKTAMMIRNATDQRFGEQAAATEALVMPPAQKPTVLTLAEPVISHTASIASTTA